MFESLVFTQSGAVSPVHRFEACFSIACAVSILYSTIDRLRFGGVSERPPLFIQGAVYDSARATQ